MLKIGSHVSMSAPEYLLGSVKEALSYDSSALMIYTGAPQNSKRAPIENLKIQEGRELWLENGYQLDSMIIHAPYIINLANTIKPEVFDISCQVLLNEIKRSKAIGARYLVLHPGSHLTASLQEGMEKIIEGLNSVLSQCDDSIIVCLETMAGKGKEVGWQFEQLKTIMDNVNYPLGVCFDSCHVNDAGYDLTKIDDVLNHFDKLIGLDKMYCLHINDSKNQIGARKDRHANIGEGSIGLETLKEIVHHPLLQEKIFILETPYKDNKAPYKEEIALLRG